MNVPARGSRLAVSTATTGTVLIAAAAFWLSFTALTDLAERSGIDADQAWAWPLIVDGLIVVATVAVIALDGMGSSWYPWLLLIVGTLVSVIANALHATVAADDGTPLFLAGAVAAVPPLVLLASTHLTVVLVRSGRTLLAEHEDGFAASAAASSLELLLPVPLNDPIPEVIPRFGRNAPAAEPTMGTQDGELESCDGSAPAGEPSAGQVEADDEVAPHILAPAPPIFGEPVVPVHAVSAPDAVRVFPTDRSTRRREYAAQLRSEGMSNKKIARELGVAPSTVGRWFSAEVEGNAENENDGDVNSAGTRVPDRQETQQEEQS